MDAEIPVRIVLQHFVFLVGLPDGHNFRDVNNIAPDPVKCGKMARDMETVNTDPGPEDKELLVAAFAGERIFGKNLDLCINDSFAFLREVLDKRECIHLIDPEMEGQSLYSTNFPRLQILLVSFTRWSSELLRTRSRITSS